jgi:ABC-type nickel/cobalt efflux system permease component RcnA
VSQTLFVPLAVAAVSIAALHALAPDHWLPFAALARARDWSAGRTVALTLLCGSGHVGFTVLLGAVGLWIGRDLVLISGARMESVAGVLLIVFGSGYALWSLRRTAGSHLHGGHHGWTHVHDGTHPHGHARSHHPAPSFAVGEAHIHDPSRLAVGSLFVVFSLDVCAALLPLILASAPLGFAPAATVVALYAVTTLGTMTTLALAARSGAALLPLPRMQRHQDVLAGAMIAGVGLAAVLLGL